MLAPNPAASSKAMRHYGLSTIFALGLGTLMLLGVGSVLFVSVSGASRNTTSLLRDKADLILSSIEQRVRGHLDPVEQQADYLKDMIESGNLDPADEEAMAAALRGALAATPQVAGVAFINADARVVRVERDGRRIIREDWSDRPQIRAVLDAGRDGTGGGWGSPVWSEPLGRTILALTAPVQRGGTFAGVIVPAIFVTELSRFVAAFSRPEQMAFILYGRDAVIAHPRLADGGPQGSRAQPLPSASAMADPVLASIWSNADELRFPLKPGDAGHVVERPGDFDIFIYRQLEGYGPVPWIVGAVLLGSEAGQEFGRLWRMAGIGLTLLLVAVLSAMFVGRRLAGPIRDIVTVTERVQRLDLNNVPTLPRSRIKEIDAAGQALNSMVSALRWFELYLPRRLVHALLARGDNQLAETYEREVTVLFTDMCGFSRLSTRLSAAETAALLNEHFGLIGACVEAEEGTIDKYIGDSVMAFWGAPDEQPDHAERAARAALAIAAAIRADNARREAAGLERICIRIGIGSGRVLVGNIGAAGRVNYTLVGDVVNLAQRLEQLGKEVDDACEVIALMTEASVACLENKAQATLVARREVRDRDGVIGIYRLV